MNQLERVDTWLVGRAERTCHRFQRATGKTNFFLARCALGIEALSVLIDFCNWCSPMLWRTTPGAIVVLGPLILAQVAVRIRACQRAEASALAPQALRAIDPCLVSTWRWRVTWIACAAIDVLAVAALWPRFTYWPLEIIARSFAAAIAMAHYVLAVRPLPPCRAAIAAWMRDALTSLVPARLAEARHG